MEAQHEPIGGRVDKHRDTTRRTRCSREQNGYGRCLRRALLRAPTSQGALEESWFWRRLEMDPSGELVR